MPGSDYERAMAEGALRSRAAAGGASAPPRLPKRTDGWRAHGGWLGIRLRDLWERRRRLLFGLGLFLLFDLIAALAAVTMGTHF